MLSKRFESTKVNRRTWLQMPSGTLWSISSDRVFILPICILTKLFKLYHNFNLVTLTFNIFLKIVNRDHRLLVESPPSNSLLVSCVLPAVEYEFEEEVPSLDSDTYPVNSEKRDWVVVPDVVVYHIAAVSIVCRMH